MMELLRQLVQAESTPEKGELAVAQIISQELGRAQIDARIDCWDRNRANLVAHVESTGHKDALLFACHLDVVPPGQAKWEHPPFAGIESNGRIYGRGSADMKGGIVATLSAIKQIVESGVKLDGDIILTAAAGEETDSCGAKRFVSSHKAILPTLAGVVLPEPTDFEVVTAHRGMLWLEVITRGKAAHGSTPELGVNAITSMKAILDKLEDYEIAFEPHESLGGCSMSINTISGGPIRLLLMIFKESWISSNKRILSLMHKCDLCEKLGQWRPTPTTSLSSSFVLVLESIRPRPLVLPRTGPILPLWERRW
jgi:succinyl-diaminopimelate desuccinylase